jgi:hypothetical protein
MRWSLAVLLCAALPGVALAQESLGTHDFEGNASTWDAGKLDEKERHGGLRSLKLDGDGTATQKLVAADVRGKRVKVSGWIRGGGAPAYLWIHATGGKGSDVFDDLRKRGTTSAKGWTRVDVTMQVPHDADTVTWGVAATKGSAWFDDLAVTAGDERPQEIEKLK